MRGSKAKQLRRFAVRIAQKPAKLGYVQRKIPYMSVDRHGKPKRKWRRPIQLMWDPQSWIPTYRRLKRAYHRNPVVKRAFDRA